MNNSLKSGFLIMAYMVLLFGVLVAGYVQGVNQTDVKSLFLLRMTRNEVQGDPTRLFALMEEMDLSKKEVGDIILTEMDYKARTTALSEDLKNQGTELVRYLVSPDATADGARERKKKITALVDQMVDERIDSWFVLRQQVPPEKLSPLYDYVESSLKTYEQ